jgi:hypothetical protein
LKKLKEPKSFIVSFQNGGGVLAVDATGAHVYL